MVPNMEWKCVIKPNTQGIRIRCTCNGHTTIHSYSGYRVAHPIEETPGYTFYNIIKDVKYKKQRELITGIEKEYIKIKNRKNKRKEENYEN